MEPHALAIAALDQATKSSSASRNHADKLMAWTPNATGVDMATDAINTIVPTIPHAQEPSHALLRTAAAAAAYEDEEELGLGDQNNAAMPENASDSQSTTDSHDVATPPTSASEGFSSQSTNQDGPMSQLSQLSQLAAAQQPLTNTSAARPTLSIASTAGQKRTADGQVKSGVSGSPQSPRARGHSRNTSTVSNVSAASSRIGEVRCVINDRRLPTDAYQISSELRARLSYAMVKVNNGWQSNSIDEVESLASQAGSPTSSTSTLHGRRSLITSPRTAIANLQGQTSGPSQSPADFDLYSANGQPSRTYESFWRDHSATNPAHRYPSHPSASSPPPSKSLAPPADIRPTPTSRRSGTPKFSKPPTIPGQHSNSSLRSSAPRTPNRNDYRDNTIIQTPTQKTIQEQDAIETLLFMSSPGNSGNMGPNFPGRSQASPQQSPLRAEFSMQGRANHGKKVGFDVPPVTRGSTESSEAGGAEYRRSHMSGSTGVTSSREAAIDRMLEEIGDSSSDEEELVLKYSSPRRSVAAGR
ncbi:hypothetical protein G7Y89_g1213 [Cudoniella acicularis]|uniref:Uncharacterized protein n=1 Tax=Cudoniella acicularis TaxID=354080 RepID=A0A8H4W783_9HELO|nr:hypothetical protein G7Y89_g1213 [Cudoniella acicularis]